MMTILQEKKITNRVEPMPPLVIIGSGGHAVSVVNVAISAGYTIKCFVDKNKKISNLLGFNVVDSVEEVDEWTSYHFGIAIGDNALRERLYNALKDKYFNLTFPALIHASAIISSFTNLDEGTVVMPNAVIGPNSTIGKFCLINTHASVDHDCVMMDFSSIAPGAAIGGQVHIGNRSAISIGTSVKHGIKIGDDSIVGANSYLNKDMPNNQIAYGSPAKQIRSRGVGDPYL